MAGNSDGIEIGKKVPDFEIDIFDPTKGDFGKIELQSLKTQNKWTILFFYPADFTFV